MFAHAEFGPDQTAYGTGNAGGKWTHEAGL